MSNKTLVRATTVLKKRDVTFEDFLTRFLGTGWKKEHGLTCVEREAVNYAAYITAKRHAILREGLVAYTARRERERVGKVLRAFYETGWGWAKSGLPAVSRYARLFTLHATKGWRSMRVPLSEVKKEGRNPNITGAKGTLVRGPFPS